MTRPEGAGAPLPTPLAADFDRFLAVLNDARGGSGSSILASADARGAWREYGRLLYERSADLALVAKGDRDAIFTRHIMDSLNPLALFEQPPASLLDIGSGGGLPGIPLAIAWPDARVFLLESRERKAGFLEQTVRLLGLRNVQVVCERLENLKTSWREAPVQSLFIRAVGGLGEVLAEATPVASLGARWYYFLGSRDASEVLAPAASIDTRVVQGAFGGRLLTGVLRHAAR